MSKSKGKGGVFITLEGGEGGGKSTQARMLAENLKKAGYTVVLTREPGGSPGAESIRALLVDGEVARWDGITEAFLHYAARRDHVQKTVKPSLEAGRVVISDRFADSTLAYQGYGHGVDKKAIAALHKAAIGAFAPKLTLILDLPVETGLKRAAQRGGGEDRYEKMDRAFHARLRKGFLAIARKHPRRCKVIDADRDPQSVQQDILAAVMKILPGKR